MDLGADIARERGYPYWKSLTTGKSVSLGAAHGSIEVVASACATTPAPSINTVALSSLPLITCR